MRDPSAVQEIFSRLQREDPDLLMEVVRYFQSQQQG